MLILKMLEEQDLYGYEMINVLKEKSNNVFELRTGTLYSLLGKLVKNGYLECYEKKVAGKNRKYYSLTEDGKRFLKEKEEVWYEYYRAVLEVIGEKSWYGNSDTGRTCDIFVNLKVWGLWFKTEMLQNDYKLSA